MKLLDESFREKSKFQKYEICIIIIINRPIRIKILQFCCQTIPLRQNLLLGRSKKSQCAFNEFFLHGNLSNH